MTKRNTYIQRLRRVALGGMLALWGAGLGLGLGNVALVHAAERVVPSSQAEITLSYAALVKKTAPAVVNIYTEKRMRRSGAVPLFDDPFFRRFFGDKFGPGVEIPGDEVQNTLGSGVIVDGGAGLIVTNHHVVEAADEIKIVLSDRREFAAKLIGSDPRTDLAVLRIDTQGEHLPSLPLLDSDEIEVGDLVLAIGNPFGVGQTVTSGIVSALARTRVGVSDLNSFIQTDAAINPGNSGGALVSMDGRLAGINTAIFSKSGGSLGIGFAIPANMVRSVLSGVTKDGRLVRPWLGAVGQSVSADLAMNLGMARPYGVMITQVHGGSPANRAGLVRGDVVLSIAGHEVADPQDLSYRIATLPIGTTAEVIIWRKQARLKLNVMLAPPPEIPPRNITLLEGAQPLAGASVGNLSPAFAEELGLGTLESGVIVLEIHRGSHAAKFGFRPGDKILSVNGQKISRVRELVKALSVQLSQWRLSVRRGERTMNLVIQ